MRCAVARVAALLAAVALLAARDVHAAPKSRAKRPRRATAIPAVAAPKPTKEAETSPMRPEPKENNEAGATPAADVPAPRAAEGAPASPPAPEITPPPAAALAPAAAEAPLPSAALEKHLELGGRLFTYIRAPLDGVDEPLQQLSTTLWIDARARVTEGSFAAFSVVGDLLAPSTEGKTEARGRIREAYAGAHSGGLEARIGHQILAWGNSDGLHAVDFLTAQDYSFYSVTADARQIGAPSVELSYKPDGGASPFGITLVWQPVAPSSKLFVPKGSLPANVTLRDEDNPRFSVADSEGAVKIGWSPGGWDISVIGFHGQNHLAEPYLKSLENGVAEIGRAHHRINAAGMQASVALDSWVLRLEAAYVMTENADGRNRLLQPTYGDAIAGIERPLGDRVRVGVQGLARWYPYYLPLEAPYVGVAPEIAAVNRELAHVNSQLLNYTHQLRPGASLLAAYTSEDEALELSVAGLAYFTGFDWGVEPTIGYRFLDSLKVDVGAQVFGGHRNSLGFLAPRSGVFAQATYAF